MPYFRQIPRLVFFLLALAASMLAPAAGPGQQKYLVYVGTYN
jgi:hypothetical protein